MKKPTLGKRLDVSAIGYGSMGLSFGYGPATAMQGKPSQLRDSLATILTAVLLSACATAHRPLNIEQQGSFTVGGTVVSAPGTFDPIQQGAFNPAGPDSAGQTLHGDHAYAFYQVPVDARQLPLVFWHGHGQSAKTWETTPDGREGFQTIFLRRRFPVYLIDQPRRGRAARGTQAMNVSAAPDEQLWFGIFRLGVWPELFPACSSRAIRRR